VKVESFYQNRLAKNSQIDFDDIKKSQWHLMGMSSVNLVYIKEREAFCLQTKSGYILGREDVIKLTDELLRSFNRLGKDEIAEHNQEMLEREMSDELGSAFKKRDQKPGWIYVCTKEEGVYKIGLSGNIARRMRQLGKPSLYHFFETDNMDAAEQDMHSFFRDKHIERELFRLSNNDLSAIKDIAGYKDYRFIYWT